MPSPFPGMDPYLEHPGMWPEVQHRLISAIADSLEQTLSLDYRVAIEKRTYLSVPEDSVLVGIPDVSVYRKAETTTATAVMPKTQSASVTVTLPMPEEIKEGYLEIRDIATGEVVTAIEVLSPTNKRPGMGLDAYKAKRQTVLGSQTQLYAFNLEEPIPVVGIPLKTGEAEIPLDLQILLNGIYDRARYGLTIDYAQTPIPQLRQSAQAWAQQRIGD
jgi:Protein of unknown function (DUF4058)